MKSEIVYQKRNELDLAWMRQVDCGVLFLTDRGDAIKGRRSIEEEEEEKDFLFFLRPQNDDDVHVCSVCMCTK